MGCPFPLALHGVPFFMASLASFQEGNCLMVFHFEPAAHGPMRMTA